MRERKAHYALTNKNKLWSILRLSKKPFLSYHVNACSKSSFLVWQNQHKAQLMKPLDTLGNKLSRSLFHLRASFCKYRKSRDSFKNFSFLRILPKHTFKWVIFENIIKISQRALVVFFFFRNRGKFENRHSCCWASTPSKMPGVNDFLFSFYSVILKLGTKKNSKILCYLCLRF